MDQWDVIDPASITIPGSPYTGVLYSTCDPNLNSELPPGHPNTLVSPAIWQMVNYILNHHTYNHTNAFYWDIQTAINTLVGSGVGAPDGCGGILTTPTPSGLCGYPTNHPAVVQALLTAATNNAATWTPQCGDVYGVVYVTPLVTPTNQFLLLEVPVCPGSIGVTKQVACLQPTNDCGVFGSIATGYLGTNQPGFCYEITITNSGDIPLSNIVVLDNLLGTLTTQFTNFLAPGTSSTAFFKMAFAADATNTVTVTGDAFLAHSVTNGDTIIAPGTPFTAAAQAVALVEPATIACTMTLSSPLDISNGINPNAVYLPSATIYSTPPVVTFGVTVYNFSSSATLSNITLTSDALTSLGCTMPPPFTLLPGAHATFAAFCAEQVACPGLTLSVNATGQVMPGGPVCGVYDITSTNLIAVTTGCMGTISCGGGPCSTGTATLSGHVYVHCDGTTPVAGSDAPMANVTVSLLNAGSVVVATTTTDANGLYTFTGMAAGTYTVQATPPANYVQTFPNGSSTSQVQFTVAPCDNHVQDFGYADHSPVTVSIPPGSNLGCNPPAATLPTDASVQATATASDDRGPITAIVVTHTTSTSPSGCVVTMVFTATATGTCGVQNTATATYTYQANTTPPVISGAPTSGFDLGCNPTSVLGDTDISNLVTVAGNCASATTFTVTHVDSINNCAASRVFTIIATDACRNSATQHVTYTWTANTTPPVIAVPAGMDLGCNPTSIIPTVASVSNSVQVAGNCASATTYTVTSQNTLVGCADTLVFTITATDACNNTATKQVTYTWTANTTPPVITVPAGMDLGCNPTTTVPTVASVSNSVQVAGNCASATTYTVTSQNTLVGCADTLVFTITARDACNNTATKQVTYTWTVNTTPPSLTVPPGISYGCNPASERGNADVKVLSGATGNCGSATTITVTHSDSISGCVTTRRYTVTATDSCNNSATANVIDTWTIDTTAPSISGVPTSGLALGCNPATLPTDATITGLVSATDNCGSATITVSHVDSTSGCVTTRTFTITATDTCGNHVSATVAYTWTIDTTAATISGVPTTGLALGCNPANPPTDASITSHVSATDNCGSATIAVSHVDSTSGCVMTRTFTITATDGCRNNTTATVAYTWTVDTTAPVLSGVPAGGSLGCNPATTPTDSSVRAMVSATDNCSTTTISVTHVDATSGCSTTRTFTITATDACGNVASATAVYVWSTASGTLTLTGVPAAANLGCNPATIPTAAQVAALVSAGSSSSVTWAFTNYPGTLGVSQAFTQNGLTITAYGFKTNGTAIALYGKLGGGDENGLGLNGTVENEIGTSNFIQLDLTQVIASGAPSATMAIGSVQSGEGYNIYGSHTLGTLGTLLVSNGVTDGTAFPIPSYPTYQYISVQASAANVLLDAVSIASTGGCSGATVSGASTDTTSGCVHTRVYTITGSNLCGSVVTAYTTNTWTIDTTAPVISGVPTSGLALGCNPATLPTDASIAALVSETDNCGSASEAVTHVDSTSGCVTTRSFAITATDACGNHATATVVYTWTTDTGPVVTCPPNVTIATNFAPVYCTFTPSDWNSSCNGSNTTATWWNNWAQQNRGINCVSTWTNWWTSCTGNNPGTNFWNFCQSQSGGNNNYNNGYGWNNWFGGSWSQNNTPSWCANWNIGNNNNSAWVPCNGFNPGSVLTNCFNVVYTNHCVVVGLTNGNCYKFTSCNAVRQCLSFTGSAGSLNCSATNPASCNAGNFCSQVLALQLNCDFGDAGGNSGLGGPCGDLVYNDSTSPCNGQKVRDICKLANCVLGGGSAPSGCTASYLNTLCSNLNQCFEGCQVSSWCHTHLTPVYIPPPSVTGTATVTAGPCSTGATLSYCDSVANGTCTGSYVITRTWFAVDNAGMSNYCQQTIKVIPCPPVTNSITCNFNSQMPSSGWMWCNAHISCAPGVQTTIHCQNAAVTIVGHSGRTYTYPVPDCDINFSNNCTTASCNFDGTKWHTCLPTAGDDEIFLAGCAIPCNSDFAGSHSVTWTGVFTCDQPGVSFNWQWGAACYNTSAPQCSSIHVKACHQTSCGYNSNSGDHAGTPENEKSGCVGGGTGGGGSNWTGSWSSTGSCALNACN